MQGPGIHEFATEAMTVPNPLGDFRAFGNMAQGPAHQADPRPTSRPSFPVFLQDCSTVRCPQNEGVIAPPGMTKRAS